MTFADSEVEYYGSWGSFRLLIGGKDVTYWRGVPAEVNNYQLLEPYGFGPADFTLPQMTMFEADEWGTGSLSWFDKGKRVVLKQVDASGSVVRTIWRGFVSVPEVTSAGVRVHCEGEATGRLSMRAKLPDLFAIRTHVGRKIYTAFRQCRLDLTPYLGNDIGVKTDGRAMSGSYLDYVDGLLAATIGTDGSQYTIHPKAAGGYRLEAKDTTTVDCTAFLGAHGVDPDLSSDMSEEPNTVYGSGVSPEGLVWVNGRYPGLIQGDAPDYPMDDDSSFGEGTTDGDTDSGDGVSVLVSKLWGMGYLDREDRPGGYDADVTAAVKDLQDDAGLSTTGNVNVATWNALFDLDATGYSLLQTFIHPLAQASAVRKWNRTSNGSPASRNPNFDPRVVQVDFAVDHGSSVEKSRARKWSQGVLARAQAKNWNGTITLTSDVFDGDVTAADEDLDTKVMSRLDITPGMNLRLRHFDNNTLFHVSIVNVSVDPQGGIQVQLGVDTRARDAATLGEVIARNIESREHPARLWKRSHRANVNQRHVEFSEVGGLVNNKVACPGDQWTVIPVIAGQAGTINRVRVQTTDSRAAFVTALFAEKVTPAWLHAHIGDPFDTNSDGESKWTNANIQAKADSARSLLGAWGDADQPCGYHPRRHTGDDGNATDAPITGLMLEDAGFDYHTFGYPVVYLCVWPDRDTHVAPQRVLWEVLDSSTGL